MRYIVRIVFSALCIFGIENQTNGARILAIMHIPSYSHQISFRPLWRKLVERGHELVLITPNSMLDTNATNCREIILESISNTYNVNYVQMRLNGVPFISYLGNDFAYLLVKFSNYLFDHPEVRKLYDNNSKEKFDLVMIEIAYSTSLFAFAHRFNAPVIGVNSLGLTTFDTQMLGGLVMASHEATWEMESNVESNLPFWKRLKNFCTMWYLIYKIHRHIHPLHQKIAEEHMGAPLPPMIDIAKNTSLVFINEHPVMTYGSPKLPNIIRFYFLHVSEETKPFPQDLKNFVDSATDGFIYFSVGTTVRFSNMPDDIQQIFYDVFAKLPYKVVWKNEEKLLRKSDNIYVSSWYPQRRILAHSNIKLFVYQGGSQSTQEAIHHAVPVLGFPILSDQDFLLRKLKSLGVGNHLNLEDLTTDTLKSTILGIIRNKKYKRNMIELRRLLNDTPYNLLDNLVWWTEFVIRNRGVPHLRSTLADQPWYQHVDMDIVAFLAVVAFIVFLVGLWISIRLLAYAYKQGQEVFTSRKRKTD